MCVGATLETDDLSRAFRGRWAVDGLTLEADAGEVLALLGPNGAGKTTTVRLLDGVLRPDRGRCRVLGLDPVVDGGVLLPPTAVLTEEAGLDDRLTARENIASVARIRGLRGPATDRRIGELLDRLGVGARADQRLAGASTGQRKRVALARALVHDPELLFLDEPTSGLDPAGTREVVAMIGELATEHGRTVVLCTHFLPEASRLATRVAVLHRGRLQAFGRPDDLADGLADGLPVDLDLGRTADPSTVAELLATPGVSRAEALSGGARVVVGDREALPGLVAALTGLGLPVYAVMPRPPTLEDVYFALQERAVAAEAAGT
jgi:ABC-2 type transport system ATP-binding protein